MRVWIVFLVIAIPLSAQNPAVRRPAQRGGTAPPQQVLPADCLADGTVVNGLTGQPLPRANVTPNTTNGSGTSTDAEGKWTISNITCGSVIFTAEKDGFIQNTSGRPASSPRGSGINPKPVVLTSGSEAHSLKIELMPESIVTGRVVDELGEPAVGAQVRMMVSVVQNGRRTTQNSGGGAADSTGVYRIGGLVAGRYFFCATSNHVRYPVGGGSPVVFGESCFPGPVTGGAGSGLQVDGGREVRADFTLRQVTGIHVRGSVSGGGESQFGAVQMFRTDGNGMIAMGPMRPQQVRNGKFDFPNVTPGSYILRANTNIAGEVQFANASLEVGTTDIEGVSLFYGPGVAVSGTVTIEDIGPANPQAAQQNGQQGQNPPPDTSGRPPVNINLNPLGFGGPIGRIQWDSEHKSFVYPDVQAGKYRINVNSPGRGYFIKSVRLNDHEIRADGFTVSGPTGPIQIVVSNASGTLQGTVVDTDGKPAASQIILQCGDIPVIQGRSQDDGTVNISNVPAGPCRAWAFDDGRNVEYADEEWMRRNAGIGADVTITSGSSAQVSLVRKVVPQ